MYRLKLYLVDNSLKSKRLVDRLRNLLEERCLGEYELEIIDVLKNPDLAERERILATPTMVKFYPEPSRRIIGDVGDGDRVFTNLGIF